MKTIEDFLATLSEEERAFLDRMPENLKNVESYILLDGQVVKTHVMVAILWEVHNPGARRIAKTVVNEVEISTVFITSHLPNDKHFETMCFDRLDSRVAGRYKTLKEAIDGHNRLSGDGL